MDCDEIKGKPGIYNFWLTVFKNHQLVQDYVKKHDEPLLKHLKDVRGKLHSEGYGMTLEFEFDEGIKEWFEETLLLKTYHMVDEDVLE